VGRLRHIASVVVAIVISFGSLLFYSWSVAHGLLMDQFVAGGVALFESLRLFGDMRPIIDGYEAVLWLCFVFPYLGLTILELGARTNVSPSSWMIWPIGIALIFTLGGIAQETGVATFGEAILLGGVLVLLAATVHNIRSRRT
jgi:hypothetical protein